MDLRVSWLDTIKFGVNVGPMLGLVTCLLFLIFLVFFDNTTLC